MSVIFWTGVVLFVVTSCGLIFAVWQMRGRPRNNRK